MRLILGTLKCIQSELLNKGKGISLFARRARPRPQIAVSSFWLECDAEFEMPGTILYATSLLPVGDAYARVPRARQSEAARDLQVLLSAGVASNVGSRSHSRAAVAAAVGDAQILTLGIDIEFLDDGRPFAALAGYFSANVPPEIGAADFYRRWTFAEAYFKAYQLLPTNDALSAVGRLTDNEVLSLDDGTKVLQQRIAERFRLCLVWRALHEGCDVRYIQQ
jgi:hypothetical protein